MNRNKLKETALILMLSFMGINSFAQNEAEADRLVNEGIVYHDKGDYDGAIAKYDQALELDTDNLLALAEKAYSLTVLQKYEDAIIACKHAIEAHPGAKELRMVYVTYGNAADGLNDTEKALAIYGEGIKVFPDFYLLHFNRGISLWGIKKDAEANLSFQRAVVLNADHASSHNAIARLASRENSRIAALLAYCRFLVLEPQSSRAKENLASVQRIMKANVGEKGKGVTINLSADMVNDVTAKGQPKENNFSTVDMILSMATALDYDKQFKKDSEVQQFIRKLNAVCASLKEGKNDDSGFFWDYYVPYFIEMKDKDLIETCAYIAYASSENADVMKWLKNHSSEIDKFLEWSKSYPWKSD